MTEPGTCDIFTAAEQERPIKTYRTYKCSWCNRPADYSLEMLVAHFQVDHRMNVVLAS